MSNNNFLNQKEVQKFELLFKLTQSQLKKIMKNFLNKHYLKNQIISTDSYILAMGNIPVAIVAHLDTVLEDSPKKYLEKEIFYDSVKGVFFSNSFLGSDDRAGVYAIIRLLSKGYKPTVILTTDEEMGAIGAEKLIKDFPHPTIDLKYIIELDRRGSNDCVFYDCANTKFEDYVESFGFVTNYGSFSDISIICPAWEIAGVNLSIGYKNEHSTSEHLFVGHMLATIQKVEEMFKDINNADKFKYIPNRYSKLLYKWDPSYGVSEEEWNSWYTTRECVFCGHIDFDYNMIPVKSDSYNKTLFVCPECVSSAEGINWCSCCGEAFFDINSEVKRLCSDCEAKKLVDSNK